MIENPKDPNRNFLRRCLFATTVGLTLLSQACAPTHKGGASEKPQGNTIAAPCVNGRWEVGDPGAPKQRLSDEEINDALQVNSKRPQADDSNTAVISEGY